MISVKYQVLLLQILIILSILFKADSLRINDKFKNLSDNIHVPHRNEHHNQSDYDVENDNGDMKFPENAHPLHLCNPGAPCQPHSNAISIAGNKNKHGNKESGGRRVCCIMFGCCMEDGQAPKPTRIVPTNRPSILPTRRPPAKTTTDSYETADPTNSSKTTTDDYDPAPTKEICEFESTTIDDYDPAPTKEICEFESTTIDDYDPAPTKEICEFESTTIDDYGPAPTKEICEFESTTCPPESVTKCPPECNKPGGCNVFHFEQNLIYFILLANHRDNCNTTETGSSRRSKPLNGGDDNVNSDGPPNQNNKPINAPIEEPSGAYAIPENDNVNEEAASKEQKAGDGDAVKPPDQNDKPMNDPSNRTNNDVTINPSLASKILNEDPSNRTGNEASTIATLIAYAIPESDNVNKVAASKDQNDPSNEVTISPSAVSSSRATLTAYAIPENDSAEDSSGNNSVSETEEDISKDSSSNESK